VFAKQVLDLQSILLAVLEMGLLELFSWVGLKPWSSCSASQVARTAGVSIFLTVAVNRHEVIPQGDFDLQFPNH
jgi:hypothetical protein